MAHRRLALSLILRLSCHLSEAVLSEVSAESKLMWRIQQALVTHLFFKFSCSLAFATSCHVSRHKTPPRSRAASASPLNLVRVVVALRLKRRIWVDLCTRQNLGIRIPFLSQGLSPEAPIRLVATGCHPYHHQETLSWSRCGPSLSRSHCPACS